MEYKTFSEEEIPYQTLEQFGLSLEMVEDLPEAILDEIKSGRRSPALPIMIQDEEGNSVKSRTRFRFIRQEDGTADVVFYPQLKRCELGQYSKEDQEALLAGRAIVSHSPDDDKVKCFVQIDPDTNQVLYIPTPVIGRNLRSLMDNYRLSSAEITLIQNGSPLTIMDGEEIVTAGIDLSEKTGIRIVVGDAVRWAAQREQSLAKYNFGIFGCWVKGDDGSLDYIHEDDYTEELLQEQKKVIAQNSAIKR